MHETFPPSNGVAAGRTAQPILEVDEYRAQHVWIQAVLTHPELQAGGRRNMQRVVMHLAYEVGYDPRLWEYGRCWPLVGTLAEWARLSRGGGAEDPAAAGSAGNTHGHRPAADVKSVYAVRGCRPVGVLLSGRRWPE